MKNNNSDLISRCRTERTTHAEKARCIATAILFAAVILSTLSFTTLAVTQQEDVAGSRDHPLLSRMPNSHITEYRKQFDSLTFIVENGQNKTIEGEATVLRYFYNSPEQQPSPLQVIRNYQNAAKLIGGRVVYEKRPEGVSGGETTILITRDDKEIWIAVRPEIFIAPTQSYQLFILERGVMTQQVTADQMYVALKIHRPLYQLRFWKSGTQGGR